MEYRCWLLTWTTYGSWLPGDRRGSTSSMRGPDGTRARSNVLGTPPGSPQPGLEHASRRLMRDSIVRLTRRHADLVASDFHRTAAFRGWRLLACAVMWNHVHLVVAVADETSPAHILRDFKRRASRALNTDRGRFRPWWTRSGSTRRLATDENVLAAIRYVHEQWRPLHVWVDPAAGA